MSRLRVAIHAAALSLLVLPAYAQTAADIQAMEVAASAQYNVPIQVLQDLIYGESSNNPTIGCNSYGACGLAQFIPGTAKDYGVNVNDAQSSIAGAAHYLSDLQASKGSWSQALTSYSGGCSPSHPCNPAYAQAFQVAQAADNGTLTAADGTPLTLGSAATTNPDGSTSTFSTLSTAGSSVASVTTVGFTGFSWVWDQWQSGVQSTLTAKTEQIREHTYGTLGNLIVLMLAGTLALLLFNIVSWPEFYARMMRAAIVVVMIGASTNYLANWVMAGFASFPDTIAGWLGINAPGAAAFDKVVAIFNVKAGTVMQNIPFPTASWFEAELKLTLGAAACYVGVGIAFVTYWLSQAAMAVLALFGPLFAVTLMFEKLSGVWWGYVKTLMLLSLTATSSIILASLLLDLMGNALAGISAQANGTGALVAAAGLLQAAIVAFALCVVIGILPWIFGYICYGAIGSALISRSAGVETLAQGAGAAPAAAAGGAVSAGAGILRPIAAVGSSLSR